MHGRSAPPAWMAAFFERSNADRLPLREALATRGLLVVSLCAAWCDTCGTYQTAFERLAKETHDATFLWLDIEDDADLVGEVEVDNFPTLAVFEGSRLLHFGVSLPQEGQLRRLLRALVDSPADAPRDEAVLSLHRQIEQWSRSGT